MNWLTKPILSLVILVVVSGCNSASIRDQVREVGFVPTSIGSTLYRPGSVVWFNSEEVFQIASIACRRWTTDDSIVAAIDHSQNKEIRALSSRTFSIGAKYLESLSAGANLSDVESVSLRLSKVAIASISNDEFQKGLRRANAECVKALNSLPDSAEKGLKLGFLDQALRADATYTVEFRRGASLTADAKEKILKNIAASLEGTVESIESATISGQGLFWGVMPPNTHVLQQLKAAKSFTGVVWRTDLSVAPKNTGSFVDGEAVGDPKLHGPGVLVYGPYVQGAILGGAGRYVATFEIFVDNSNHVTGVQGIAPGDVDKAVRLDVHITDGTIGRVLSGNDFGRLDWVSPRYRLLSIPFSLDATADGLLAEFRVIWFGNTFTKVRKITVGAVRNSV